VGGDADDGDQPVAPADDPAVVPVEPDGDGDGSTLPALAGLALVTAGVIVLLLSAYGPRKPPPPPPPALAGAAGVRGIWSLNGGM